MGRGSAESRLRGMGRGSVGAWLRGKGSAGEEFRGMGSSLSRNEYDGFFLLTTSRL